MTKALPHGIKIVATYNDGMCIYSETFPDHMLTLSKSFQRTEENRWTVKSSKIAIGLPGNIFPGTYYQTRLCSHWWRQCLNTTQDQQACSITVRAGELFIKQSSSPILLEKNKKQRYCHPCWEKNRRNLSGPKSAKISQTTSKWSPLPLPSRELQLFCFWLQMYDKRARPPAQCVMATWTVQVLFGQQHVCPSLICLSMTSISLSRTSSLLLSQEFTTIL